MAFQISTIFFIFIVILVCVRKVNEKNKELKNVNANTNVFDEQTRDNIKSIISEMCELLDANKRLLNIFLSMLNCIKEEHFYVYDSFKNERDLFFENNEENIVRYRELQSELFKIVDKIEMNKDVYFKLDNACSAGHFCFDEMRNLFVATTMYFLMKDNEKFNDMIMKIEEISKAHEVSQYIREIEF